MPRPRLDTLFEELAKAFEQAVRTSTDLKVDIELTFEEAIKGCEKKVEYRRLDHCGDCGGDRGRPGCAVVPCPRCAGTGRLELRAAFVAVALEPQCNLCLGQGSIPTELCARCHGVGLVETEHAAQVPLPAGVRSGESRSVAGAGHRLRPGASARPLVVRVAVQRHPVFDRKGSDLVCSVPVSFSRAALGGVVNVPTLEGTAVMKVPSGTNNGVTLKLRGGGLPRRFGGRRGDQLVTILVEVPRNLSERAREVLQQLAAELDVRKRKPRPGIPGRVRRWIRGGAQGR